MYSSDKRIVVTLDAGGTNFVFGAMRGCEFVVEPITYPSNAHDLDLCLQTMVKGFREVISQLPEQAVAISFAFPGPADYSAGIIDGFIPNFPSFREGVALGPYLKHIFNLPVYINNDGDLYAYGEALCGILPEINSRLEACGSVKRYRNLIGYTFGTGFGVGIVLDGRLNLGDNSCVETFCLRHNGMPDIIVEDGVSVRAVKRVYSEQSGEDATDLTPKDIYDIATGQRAGNREAALKAFDEMGNTAGEAMAVAATLIDGLIVVGGGITAAKDLMKDGILRAMRGEISTLNGEKVRLVQPDIYYLDDDAEFDLFAKSESRTLLIPGTDIPVVYDPKKRIGIAFSKLGASKAISVGAYAYALSQIDR